MNIIDIGCLPVLGFTVFVMYFSYTIGRKDGRMEKTKTNERM